MDFLYTVGLELLAGNIPTKQSSFSLMETINFLTKRDYSPLYPSLYDATTKIRMYKHIFTSPKPQFYNVFNKNMPSIFGLLLQTQDFSVP